MPDYCQKACQLFQHENPKKPQHQPYPHLKPTYGAKKQFSQPEDKPPLLNADDKIYIQEVVGVFLYYTREVDCTMLAALRSLAAQQANPTEYTMKKIKTISQLRSNTSRCNNYVQSK